MCARCHFVCAALTGPEFFGFVTQGGATLALGFRLARLQRLVCSNEGVCGWRGSFFDKRRFVIASCADAPRQASCLGHPVRYNISLELAAARQQPRPPKHDFEVCIVELIGQHPARMIRDII